MRMHANAYLTHKWTARITETGVATSAIKPGAEHVVGESIQREEERSLPALFRRDQRQLDLLQSVGWTNKHTDKVKLREVMNNYDCYGRRGPFRRVGPSR